MQDRIYTVLFGTHKTWHGLAGMHARQLQAQPWPFYIAGQQPGVQVVGTGSWSIIMLNSAYMIALCRIAAYQDLDPRAWKTSFMHMHLRHFLVGTVYRLSGVKESTYTQRPLSAQWMLEYPDGHESPH